ncbi:hypothetical protein [Nocardioides sp.]|uniref:hypothetical protein n=1 Tax=Nocardioides sp. TaxID=35761 RepID=UPI002D808640|nr:hypothetical protein [Nocardioides sp.]HET8962090.1 hypothetical protein [Nocardioides sp.]
MSSESWSELAHAQAGMVSQGQLTELGVSRSFVRNQLRARRWAQRTSSVFSTTTGPLSRSQCLWRAVLHAGPTAMIGGLTAAELHGLKNWSRDDITVLVDDELSFDPIEGVDFVRSRRPLASMRSMRDLPLCRLEPAILLFAGYVPSRRTAHGVVAASVQQRLTTPDRLNNWLARMTPLRRAPEFRTLLRDISGGAHSLSEIDLRRACERFGLTTPRGQRSRRDRRGRRRWTDAEWDLPDGCVLVLEVDGGYHDEVRQAAADRSRHRKLVTRRRIIVSCSSYELRHEPESVMEDLIALGVPRTR